MEWFVNKMIVNTVQHNTSYTHEYAGYRQGYVSVSETSRVIIPSKFTCVYFALRCGYGEIFWIVYSVKATLINWTDRQVVALKNRYPVIRDMWQGHN